jgi:Rrf2 family nitric oxide-sensitive transcriptional repressor
MRLTSFTDYSLRVLVYLAAQPGRRATIAQVASSFGISENHLVKVVHFLGKQGWLRNVRGKGGGLELGRPAAAIRIGDLVRDTERVGEVVECYGGVGCVIAPVCRLRGVLAEAVSAFHSVLDRYTLEDIASNRQELSNILFFEPLPASAVRRKAAA